ncbi:hypothetical protein SRRS_05200 [Sporomusa rhizae]|uniref:hypothetical protein n=1 Tax=Sporomusa rhizae TaxID=357999 RepID=UPI00352AAAD0
MNFIKAELTTTEYVNGEHLMIFVDDIRLDKWLSSKLDDKNYLGLIPTWLGWLVNPKEQEYVWIKTKLCETKTTIVPMLICPDDLDFSCTIIVCEVKYTDTSVQWTRIGIDRTGRPNYIGRDIEWLENVPSLHFLRQQYEDCLNEFMHDCNFLDVRLR